MTDARPSLALQRAVDIIAAPQLPDHAMQQLDALYRKIADPDEKARFADLYEACYVRGGRWPGEPKF